MGQLRCESIQQKLEKIVPKYIARFIIWYKTSEDNRCDFKDLMPYEPNFVNKTSPEECMDWLTREDSQEALQVYMKHMKKFNLMKLYDAMYEKALGGDVNAAKWIENFSNSSFFDESQDDIEDFMKDVNIPALKGKV
ncbi:hypothetical protein [Anaerosporobacter sp.]